MGDFNFGQFQEIYEYLTEKVSAGGALTPEEQQVYDLLLGFANQGLNLTNTGDFNSLYTAFNALADEGTKSEFEKLYGTNFTQGPGGKIQFTRPGSVIEQFQRRGLSVNDGPAMAALSEGLQNYMKQIAQNKFAAMTNSYAAMTPIRAQNIQAATNAGNLGSTAAGRRVAVSGAAASGGRAGGGGEGGGEAGPEGKQIPLPPRPDQPSVLERLAPDFIKLFGGAGVAGLGWLMKDWLKDKPGKFSQDELDRATSDIVMRNRFDPSTEGFEGKAQQAAAVPDINMTAFTGGRWPDAQDMTGSLNPYGDFYDGPIGVGQPTSYYDLDPGQYYGTGSQGYQQPAQQPYDYQDYVQPQQSWEWEYNDPWGGGGDSGGYYDDSYYYGGDSGYYAGGNDPYVDYTSEWY